MLSLSVWLNIHAPHKSVVACFAKLSNTFLGNIEFPKGPPKQVLEALQRQGARLLPNDECCYSFMGVFLGDQELTSKTFMYTNEDSKRFALIEKMTQQDVARLDFMWCDQRCKDDRAPTEHSYQKDTKMLYISNSDGVPTYYEAFTKADFKTPTLGLHIKFNLSMPTDILCAFKNLKVLRLQGYSWNFQTLLRNVTNLEALSIWGEADVGQALKQLKVLHTLEIETTQRGLRRCFFSCLPTTLKRLWFRQIEGSTCQLTRDIKLLVDLVDLRLNHVVSVVPVEINELINLTTLHLGGSKVRLPILNLPNLQHLKVDDPPKGLAHLTPNPKDYSDYFRIS